MAAPPGNSRRQKPDFAMPPSHLQRLEHDLEHVSMVVSVGWRGRERHFLELLQDNLGSRPIPLVAVAESPEASEETVDNLWPTGRFDRFATATDGFTRFSQTPRRASQFSRPLPEELTLRAVLTGNVQWQERGRGSGLAPVQSVEPQNRHTYVEPRI